jgi:hypothetical protein
VAFTHVQFDAMVEGAIDNPATGRHYELYVRVWVAGEEVWTAVVRTLEGELDLTLLVVVDIPDDLTTVPVAFQLWENDTEESAGLNADDQFDIDGEGPDLPSDPDHPDAVLGFTVEVIEAPS